MFPQMSTELRASTYYGLALGMIVLVALVPWASTAAGMLTPLVATVLMLLVVTREGWRRDGWGSLGLQRLGLRQWPLAVAVPIVVVGVAHAVLWLSSAGSLSPTESIRGGGLGMLPLQLLGNIVGASVTVSLAEEIGWRGYLLPRLEHLGARRALLLSGLLHGLWHLPFVFLTDLYLPHGSRWVVVPAFVACVVSAGVFMGWLRLRSDSVWPASIAHSAHNAAITWFGAYTIASPVALEYVAGESGLLTVLGYVAVGAWLLVRAQSRGQTLPRADDRSRQVGGVAEGRLPVRATS